MTAVLWVPAGFNPNGPPVPLFVYLHGGGGTGQTLLSNFNGALTRELDKRGWIGIAPDGRRWGLASQGCEWPTSAAYVNSADPNVGPGEQDIFDAIDWVKANYPIDANRMYLSGFSMGGRGSYIIGLKNPDRFAGIAPFAPAIDMYEIFVRRPDPPECKEGMVGGRPGDSLRVDTMYTITSARFLIENAYNLPVFHGHGAMDTIAYNVPTSGRFQHGAHILFDTSWNGCHGNTNLCFEHTPTLSELRARHPNGYDWAFMFTPAGHSGDARWIEGASKSSDATGVEDARNPGNLIGAMEFLSRQALQPSPDTVVYKTYTDSHRKAYWTEIDITTPRQNVPGAVRARRNRSVNSLEVELARVQTATFDLLLAGLHLAPETPLSITVKRLVEPVYAPTLASSDEPLEPRIVLKGSFSQLSGVTVLRDGNALAGLQVTVSASSITIGPLPVGNPTVLTVRAGGSQPPPPAGTAAAVPAASLRGNVLARESLVSVFGVRVATATMSASSASWPESLAGTSVKVTDVQGRDWPAKLFFVSAAQVNFLLPAGTAKGPARITVTAGDGATSVANAEIAEVSPGLFSANGDGQGVAAALAVRVAPDGSQTLQPVFRLDPASGRHVGAPLDFGSPSDQLLLSLFGTGLRYRSSLAAVGVRVGGEGAEVLFAGPQAQIEGLDQVNVRLPRSLAGRGEVTILLTVDGQAANPVTVNLGAGAAGLTMP